MYPSILDGTTTHEIHQELSQETFTPIISQTASFLLQMVAKAALPMTNMQFPDSSSIFLDFLSIGQPKPNQPLQTIQRTPRSAPYTWSTKWYIKSDPSYKTLAFKYMVI